MFYDNDKAISKVSKGSIRELSSAARAKADMTTHFGNLTSDRRIDGNVLLISASVTTAPRRSGSNGNGNISANGRDWSQITERSRS